MNNFDILNIKNLKINFHLILLIDYLMLNSINNHPIISFFNN